MKITVAVSGSAMDTTLMAWCAQHARPGDAVHLVHAYTKRSGARYGLVNAARVNTDRLYEARRILADAYHELHAELDQDTVSLDTAAVIGRLPDVLADESDLADLLVLGAADALDSLPTQYIGCPIAIVPRGWAATATPGRDVAVVCGREIAPAAIDLAVEHARHMHMSVLVLQTLDSDGVSAEAAGAAQTRRAEQLGMQLAPWQAPDGPPIIGEVRSDAAPDQLLALADAVGILVVPPGGCHGADAVRVALFKLGIPVLVPPSAERSDRHDDSCSRTGGHTA